jgi:hypothetical protein
MAQTLSPAGFGAGRKYPHAVRAAEGPSHFLSSIGRADGPETPLVVQFVGISDAQQRAAITAFPGGKRFVLAETQPPEALLGQS